MIPLIEFQQKNLLTKILVVVTMAIISFLLCASLVGIPIFMQLYSAYDRLCQDSISDLPAKLRRAHDLIADFRHERQLLAGRLIDSANHLERHHRRTSSLFEQHERGLERVNSLLLQAHGDVD